MAHTSLPSHLRVPALINRSKGKALCGTAAGAPQHGALEVHVGADVLATNRSGGLANMNGKMMETEPVFDERFKFQSQYWKSEAIK
jgi:hypothetical protein